jgi:glutamate-1-semialdehyde 2,1-aminomutase
MPSRTILEDYNQEFAASRALFERSSSVIPGGITHDGRHIKPFPPFVASAKGSHKTSVDGRDLIDFCVGHGSLLFGHNDPDITHAMQTQVPGGTHFSAGHLGEVRWAEQIVKMVPSAEKVRFTASGTESTLLAMRLARGYTQRNTILKFEGHFHGWQDYALKGEKPPFENVKVPGVPSETLGTVAVVPSNDLAMLEERLVQGDVAAVILEPSGASWSTIPLKGEFLEGLRKLTREHGAVLIFDEVITGFRWAPGGAQQRYGITPDLTTMAKIVAGGMPGGAVAGRAEIMDMVRFTDDAAWNANRRVPQAGTYNANPLAAAAGITCLNKAEDQAVHDHCDSQAKELRVGMNMVLNKYDAPGFVWGESSVFHIALDQRCANRPNGGDLHTPEGVDAEVLKKSGGTTLGQLVEIGMLVEGVHLFHAGGLTCTAHNSRDVEETIAAFDRVIGRMKDEGHFDGI